MTIECLRVKHWGPTQGRCSGFRKAESFATLDALDRNLLTFSGQNEILAGRPDPCRCVPAPCPPAGPNVDPPEIVREAVHAAMQSERLLERAQTHSAGRTYHASQLPLQSTLQTHNPPRHVANQRMRHCLKDDHISIM